MKLLDGTITELGIEWELMKSENMMILFNHHSPQELRDISVVHDGEVKDVINVGDILVLHKTEYEILFVGDKANETLKDLGHATFKFNDEENDNLPGTICLEKKEIPDLKKGQKVILKTK